jgi:cytochrome c553
MKKLSIAIVVAALALVANSAQAATAKENFDKNCAGCHGKDGKGDTKLGQKLEVRDYTDPKVQATLKDPEMTKAIKEGLKKGDKTLMKPYAEKLSDDEIKALVKYMRDFKK